MTPPKPKPELATVHDEDCPSSASSTSSDDDPNWFLKQGSRVRELHRAALEKERKRTGAPVEKLIPDYIDGFLHAARESGNRMCREDIIEFWPAVTSESLDLFFDGVHAVRCEIEAAWLKKYHPEEYEAQRIPPFIPSKPAGLAHGSESRSQDAANRAPELCLKSPLLRNPTPHADAVREREASASPAPRATSDISGSKRKAVDLDNTLPKTERSNLESESMILAHHPTDIPESERKAVDLGHTSPKRSRSNNRSKNEAGCMR